VDAIKAWAVKSGITIVEWFVEEASGGADLAKRPILLQALGATFAHGAGTLVVQKIDRFSRDSVTAALALGELERNGASLAVAEGAGGGEDPTAQLVRAVLLAVAQFEKAMIAVRIRAALQVKQHRGEMTGKAPYGMRLSCDGKTLEPDPIELETRDKLRKMRASGMTLRALRDHAAGQGLLNRKGKPFTLAALHALVKDAA
jgi:DNA invertase Pin-like site-specific DNA recombinase